MEREDQKIEDAFVCKKCEVHMVEDEIVENAVQEGEGVVAKQYLCKKCFEAGTDTQG